MRDFAKRLGRLAALVVVALSAAGCELTESVTPEGEDALVVEAVLNAGAPVQQILLHRTIADGGVRGEPNARVVVRTPEGREIVFEQNLENEYECIAAGAFVGSGIDTSAIRPTCYRSPPTAGAFVVPGARYELRVTTPDGLELRGRTEVPGDFQIQAVGDARRAADCVFGAGVNDSLFWSMAEGAWAYFAKLTVDGLSRVLPDLTDDVPDPLELTGLAISAADTVLVVPAEIGTFDRFDLNQDLLRALQLGFPPGVDVSIVIAAVDRNYVNSVRGGSFNPSGQVRISSIVGDGVGVFGSLVPRRILGPVVDSVSDLVVCDDQP